VRVPVLLISVDGKTPLKWLPEEPSLRLRLNAYVGRTWTLKGVSSWDLGKEFQGARGFIVGVQADGPRALALLANRSEVKDGKLILPLAKDWPLSKLLLGSLANPGLHSQWSGPLLQPGTLTAPTLDPILEMHIKAILNANKQNNPVQRHTPPNPK
jgi:hypothetical protein